MRCAVIFYGIESAGGEGKVVSPSGAGRIEGSLPSYYRPTGDPELNLFLSYSKSKTFLPAALVGNCCLAIDHGEVSRENVIELQAAIAYNPCKDFYKGLFLDHRYLVRATSTLLRVNKGRTMNSRDTVTPAFSTHPSGQCMSTGKPTISGARDSR